VAFGVNREMTDWVSVYGYVSHEPKYTRHPTVGTGWEKENEKPKEKTAE
jgi:hypothetical protein